MVLNEGLFAPRFRGDCMYIPKSERQEANRILPKLMTEGLLATGTGLGVLALIFEIAADAFSVAAYQTLLAIHGAGGRHEIAFGAFAVLSVMLYLGVVPAYKGAAYLRPNSGGSGPLVEAIGPNWLRPLSWVGTSLFFLDAVFTIIISSISAADAIMLLTPEFSPYRVAVAELFAFFIMGVLVLMGPQRAVPLFLIGGGAFTIFTLFALGYVGVNAAMRPELADDVPPIVCRLVEDEVVEAEDHHGEVSSKDAPDFACGEEHAEDGVVAASADESSEGENGEGGAVLSAEEAAEAEHINETFNAIYHVSGAAFFLLFFKSMSSAMLGFSGYEVIPASGKHAAKPKWKVINTSLTLAAIFLIGTGLIQLLAAWRWEIPSTEGYSTLLIEYELVFGQTGVLTVAGILLAIILLLAQGGGYVGGAAVAANAARLGRMPRMFTDDRVGIAVIWGVSAMVIPLIPSVTLVESFYAFGFVSAFVITSTTVYFVRKDILDEAGIQVGSGEFKSLRFAAVRGMVASYIMAVVLVTQKTDALPFIITAAVILTAFQIVVSRGGYKQRPMMEAPKYPAETGLAETVYNSGQQRARDQVRQQGVVDCVNELWKQGELYKFNVSPERLHRLISYTHNIPRNMWIPAAHEHDDEHVPEPTEWLERVYQAAFKQREAIMATIEAHSHYGIFTFIKKYAHNWASDNRDLEMVERYMLQTLFRKTGYEEIIQEYRDFNWIEQPEAVWQFSRERYLWAKNQWVNLSDRITTIWTLQDVGLLPQEINAGEIIAKIEYHGELSESGAALQDMDENRGVFGEDEDGAH